MLTAASSTPALPPTPRGSAQAWSPLPTMNTVCWAGLPDGEEQGWYLSDIEEADLGAEG